jgi:hypothetical protein
LQESIFAKYYLPDEGEDSSKTPFQTDGRRGGSILEHIHELPNPADVYEAEAKIQWDRPIKI